MFEFSSFLQAGAVLFGTAIAAPLVSSDNKKSRLWGFVAMLAGSLFSLALHISLSLWIMVLASLFWAIMSVRGYIIVRNTSRNEPAANYNDIVSDFIPGE